MTVGQDLKNIKIPGSFAIVELVDGAGLPSAQYGIAAARYRGPDIISLDFVTLNIAIPKIIVLVKFLG